MNDARSTALALFRRHRRWLNIHEILASSAVPNREMSRAVTQLVKDGTVRKDGTFYRLAK